jgi:hypothetical protein
MGYTQALREQMALVGVIPVRVIQTAAQTVYSNVIDMKNHRRALIVAQARGEATKAVKGMTVKIVQCDASGTAASTALKTGSTIHIPGTVGSYAAAVYEVTAEDIRGSTYGSTFNAPNRYFKVGFTNSTVKTNMSVVILADSSRYGDGDDNDTSSVSEVAGV